MMNGNVLASEVLAEMGGEVTPARLAAFQGLCDAIVKHIQVHGEVTVSVTGTATGVQSGAGAAPFVGAGTGKVT